MYRNRFRSKTALSKLSNASNAGSSVVGTEANSTLSTTSAAETSVANTEVSPPKKGKQTKKQQSFPSEESFLAPAPSPKVKTPPTRKRPMRESNTQLSPSPVLNVTRRKARKAHDPDMPFFDRILAVCGLKFESAGDTPHVLGRLRYSVNLLALVFIIFLFVKIKSKSSSFETCKNKWTNLRINQRLTSFWTNLLIFTPMI